MGSLIFQIHLQDHLTPLLNAFNDAMPLGGSAPPLPANLVFIEQNQTRGGGTLRLMPSKELLSWMAMVMSEHEGEYQERQARHLEQAPPSEASGS